MNRHPNPSATTLLVFVATVLWAIFSFSIVQGDFVDSLGLNQSAGLLVVFVLLFIVTFTRLTFFNKRIGAPAVLKTIAMVLVTLMI